MVVVVVEMDVCFFGVGHCGGGCGGGGGGGGGCVGGGGGGGGCGGGGGGCGGVGVGGGGGHHCHIYDGVEVMDIPAIDCLSVMELPMDCALVDQWHAVGDVVIPKNGLRSPEVGNVPFPHDFDSPLQVLDVQRAWQMYQDEKYVRSNLEIKS